jgi:glycosyltransferase involved in cell wall biosynthesis
MRVAVVAEESSRFTDRRGVERVETLARRLAAGDHDVTVFTTGWWDEYTETRIEDWITYRAVTVSPARTSFLARVPALVAAARPDVVLATPAPPEAVASARMGASLARAPLVVDWFGDEPMPERLQRLPATLPDRVVTPSRYVATRAREAGATEEAVRVIPEGIDFGRIRETDPTEAVDIVFARHLDSSANLDSLLLALAELRMRDWNAVVVGDGPCRDEFEQQARDLRIADRIEFVGDCSREERIAHYRGAHVFVQTARREVFATELLWALACGCVGVVEYQAESGAHELVEGYARGFRVTSPEEIREAIEEAGSMGEWRIDESFERYDHAAIVERYLECFRAAGASVED